MAVSTVVTSHDVARLAGVSQPTVSRALRDSPEGLGRHQGAGPSGGDALGYVPSETGRALSSGRTRRVGLLLTDLENQFYPHVISPIHHELESLGLSSWCCRPNRPTPARWPSG